MPQKSHFGCLLPVMQMYDMSKVGLSNSFILTKQKTPMLIYQNLKHPLHETYAAYGIKTMPMGKIAVR